MNSEVQTALAQLRERIVGLVPDAPLSQYQIDLLIGEVNTIEKALEVPVSVEEAPPPVVEAPPEPAGKIVDPKRPSPRPRKRPAIRKK